jgi:hypothetical protein
MPRPPVRDTVPVVLPSKVMTVDYTGEKWTDDATELAKKLLKLKGVSGAKVGEKGKVTITQDGITEPDEAEIKRLVKEAGMTFKTLAKE